MKASIKYPSISGLELLQVVQRSISYKEPSSFLNHLRLPLIQEGGYHGALLDDQFEIWQYDRGINIYHVILKGKIKDDVGGCRILIES